MAQSFPCRQCSAALEYEVGTTSLACPYCGSTQEISPPADGTAVLELDFEQALETAAREEGSVEVVTARCRQCAAESTLAANVTVQRCPFCGTPLSATASSRRLLRPQSLLPFRIADDRARQAFRQWVSGLWFAPNGLARDASAGRIDGVYLPFWTFDSRTTTDWRGERGDDVKVRKDQREVTETRWSPRAGTTALAFDDVTVAATTSLPDGLLSSLEPWDLPALVPFEERYLAGFRVESWSVPLPTAFDHAKEIMKGRIASAIRGEIGGDHQRIHAQDTRHAEVRFKHLLLPVWVSSYRHAGRAFRFVVNARTGEVQGERPWSTAKIVLFVALLVVVLVLLLSLGE